MKAAEKFGFRVLETRVIDLENFDGRLLRYVHRHEKSFITCLSCGGCTATCSAGNLIEFNVRRIGLLLRRGETEGLEQEIDKCMLCGKCQLVCPRGINLRNVIMLIKKGIVKFKNGTPEKVEV
jgi:heterodisulfide reductase subunit C